MHSTRFGLAGGLDAVLILFIYGVLARLLAHILSILSVGAFTGACQICRNPLATHKSSEILEICQQMAAEALHKLEYMKILRGIEKQLHSISRPYGRSGESRDPSLIVDNHR